MEDERFFVSVIRVWAALAWADGVIASAEAEAVKRVIDNAELTEEARRQCLAFLDEEVDFDASELTELDEPARKGIYRATVKLAQVYNQLAEEEQRFLLRLRQALEIDEATAAGIEQDVRAGR